MFSCPVWKNGKFYSIDNCTCFFAHNVYRSFQDGGHICKIGLARNGRKSFQDGGHTCKIGFYLAKVTTTLFVVVYSTRRIWSVRQHAGANPTWPHSPSTLSLTSGLYIYIVSQPLLSLTISFVSSKQYVCENIITFFTFYYLSLNKKIKGQNSFFYRQQFSLYMHPSQTKSHRILP